MKLNLPFALLNSKYPGSFRVCDSLQRPAYDFPMPVFSYGLSTMFWAVLFFFFTFFIAFPTTTCRTFVPFPGGGECSELQAVPESAYPGVFNERSVQANITLRIMSNIISALSFPLRLLGKICLSAFMPL